MPPEVLMADTMFGDYLLARDGFTSDELASLRRRIHAARIGGRLRVIVTEAYLWEIAGLGLRDRAKYHRVLMTMADICNGELLASWRMRAIEEIQQRATPTLDAAMLPRERSLHVWYRAAVDDDVITWHAQRHREAKKDHRREEERKLEATIAGLDAQQVEDMAEDPTVQPWRERVFNAPETLIDSWTEDKIRGFALDEGIEEPADGWPTPQQARAFRWRKAIHVARIRGVLTEGLSHLNPGIFDVEHLSNACVYADTYVSEDQEVVRLAAELRAPMRVVTFDDWARGMLADRETLPAGVDLDAPP